MHRSKARQRPKLPLWSVAAHDGAPPNCHFGVWLPTMALSASGSPARGCQHLRLQGNASRPQSTCGFVNRRYLTMCCAAATGWQYGPTHRSDPRNADSSGPCCSMQWPDAGRGSVSIGSAANRHDHQRSPSQRTPCPCCRRRLRIRRRSHQWSSTALRARTPRNWGGWRHNRCRLGGYIRRRTRRRRRRRRNPVSEQASRHRHGRESP